MKGTENGVTGSGPESSSIHKHLAGVDIGKVLLIDSLLYAELEGLGKLRGLASALRAAFFGRLILKFEGRSGGFVFVKSMNRPDYDRLFDTVVSTAPDSSSVIRIRHANRRLPRLAPFLLLARHASSFARIDRRRPLRTIYLAARLCLYLEAAESLLRSARFHTLVVFADMQPFDNLIVQLAAAFGAETITLQHGLYVDYESHPNINRANYLNVVSRHFLAWGTGTRDLIGRFHPACRVVVCGKPDESDWIEALEPPQEGGYITVIFDQNLLRDYNRKLLRIGHDFAKEKGVRLNLRPHPYNRLEDYAIEPGTLLNAPLRGSDWILAHTSTLIHELLAAGIPVLKFATEIPALDTPLELRFGTIEELRGLVAKGPLTADRCRAFAEHHIACTGAASRARYARFFEELDRPDRAAAA